MLKYPVYYFLNFLIQRDIFLKNTFIFMPDDLPQNPTGLSADNAPSIITPATAVEVHNLERFLRNTGRDPNQVAVAQGREIAERSAGPPAFFKDKWFYRGALLSLLSIVLFSIVGVCWIIIVGKTAPDGLIAIGAAAVGAFAGIFTTSNQKI